MIAPDYCLNLLYPPGASFATHRDSPKRWGLSIVGVCLGQGALLKMSRMTDSHPKNMRTCRLDKFVEVELPRRCIYVMSDDSRNAWKHGILKQTAGHIKKHPNLYDTQHSVWNPHGMRSSLTFRSTRLYCEVMLDLYHPQESRSDEMNQRVEVMKSYKPSGKQKNGTLRDYSKKKITEEKQRLKNHWGNLLSQQHSLLRSLRFSRDLVNF
jgi:hypothetical protein